MTSGSWTVGDGSTPIHASKAWSGGNGKTEPWQGGTRAKWNNYTLRHVTRRLNPQPPGYNLGVVSSYTAAELRGITGWSSNDDLRLLNKLAEAVRGHSFDLGVNIAEAGKTYGTIVSNVRSVGSALLSLKRGNISQALRTLGSGRRPPSRGGIRPLNSRDLSGRWLETQYAFMPLISQSYEAGKALAALTGPRVLRFTVASSSKRKTINNSDLLCVADLHVSFSKQIIAELYEDLTLARNLGLVNPAEIAWELVPYSFVVDWFLPVGSYLSAWGVIPKLNGRFLTTQRGVAKQGALHGPGDPVRIPIYQKANVRQQCFVLERTSSSSLSVPRPTFKPVPEALSPRRLLSAISLIHQRLR